MCPPPASEKAAASSAQASAPARDSNPPNAQTTSIKPGLGSCSAITPLVVKMPTPMVLPTTSRVALNKPREKRCEPSTEDWLRVLPLFLPTLGCLLKNLILPRQDVCNKASSTDGGKSTNTKQAAGY